MPDSDKKNLGKGIRNFVNISDLFFLADKLKRKAIIPFVANSFKPEKIRVENAWQPAPQPPVAWYHIPAVRERWNVLITGNKETDYHEYIARKYLSKKPQKALSLGCGTGQKVLRWLDTAEFTHIDAYDLSSQRIEYARNQAIEKGLGNIVYYHVADIATLGIPQNSYDLILAEMSLHHLSPLDKILRSVSDGLKQDGMFIINEFVGPTRFQWTDRQLEAVNGLLTLIPKRYRVVYGSSKIKKRVYRPSLLRMRLTDPSEAIESSQIQPLLHELFEIIEIKQYGGTVLHLLFDQIAHNFLSDDREVKQLLSLCFEVENMLLKSSEISSDFVLLVCRKKSKLRG